MGRSVGKAALQENVRVIRDNRVDSGRLVESENDTSQDKRDHILSPKERLARHCRFVFLGEARLLHLLELKISLCRRAGTKESGVRGVLFSSAKQPTRRFRHHKAADYEQNPGR